MCSPLKLASTGIFSKDFQSAVKKEESALEFFKGTFVNYGFVSRFEK